MPGKSAPELAWKAEIGQKITAVNPLALRFPNRNISAIAYALRRGEKRVAKASATLRIGSGLCVAAAIAIAALSALLATSPHAQAQANSSACKRLAAQINAVSRTRPPNTARYARAAARQQRELSRTQAYAEQRGCNRRQFLFFGSPPPPQCGAINARIVRMRQNLAALQARVSNAAESIDARRRSLMARYDVECRQRVAAVPRERGLFERLFGGGPREQDYREIPVEPDPEERDPSERGSRNGSKAVCVRTCDGGFFPVSYSARRRNLGDLEELCSALCPNAETKLYTYYPGKEIDEAVSIEGEPYSSLVNAGKFKTRFDPACTCKPPGQSWAQALAKAEDLLDNKSKRDVIVDAKKSEELSKPKIASLKKEDRRKRSKREIANDTEAERQRREMEAEAKRAAEEAARSQAGIDHSRGSRKRVFSLHDGKELQIRGANGAMRKIRIIAPKL